jgi:hypothetical protein
MIDCAKQTALTSDYRSLNLEIFRNPEGGRVMFQPRIAYWISENKRLGTLPEIFQGLEPHEIHDQLGCSIRPYKAFNPCLTKSKFNIETEERILEETDTHRRVLKIYKTPVGNLEMVTKYTAVAHHVEQWPVRHPDDYKALEYVLREQVFEFDQELFDREDARVGNRGAPQLFIPRVNIMRLMVHWMGMEPFMFAQMNEPQKTDQILAVIDEKEEELLDVVARCPVPIINYGDNIDCHMVPPTYLMKYIKPQYERRYEILHGAGKFVHSHFDGSLKSILSCLRDIPLDGSEALTPLPQGDVTLEEIREAVPESMTLLDKLPMTHFLPQNPVEELDAAVEKIIKMFAPKLILSVSDEISPVCDIERIRRVASYVSHL